MKEIRKHSILMYLKQRSHSICAACEVRWDGGKNESYRLHKNKQGFTLIEIIVVLVIIGIVMMLAVPAVMKYSNEAAETKRNHRRELPIWLLRPSHWI